MSDSPWRHRAVRTASELETTPPELTAEQAQPWCNFIVWMPASLPAGCTLRSTTVRKEAPPGRLDGADAGRTPWTDANPSAFRYEIVGDGRRLRVKQFLYDWAFPALDHPCLWESRTRAEPLGTGDVVWFGVDYMGNRGASARLDRTMIELSVLDGEFGDEEIAALYAAMCPISDTAAERIRATPFAELSYWARYDDAAMVTVPIGLWKLSRPDRAHEGDWTATSDGLTALLRPFGLPDRLGGLAADSASVLTDERGRSETEVAYTGGPGRGSELRLIVQRVGAGRLEVPSEPTAHEHRDTEEIAIAGASVQLAWIDRRYGPFDAVWRDSATDVECKLLSSTRTGHDRDWFVAAIEELIAATRAGRG